MPQLKTVLFTLLFTFLQAGVTSAQSIISYRVSFPEIEHHEAEITVTLSDLEQEEVKLVMSRTSPGRYALHEFAKNVYSVKAVDGNGTELSVERPDLHSWVVGGHDGTVQFSYMLFADRADGTYSGINRDHAHLNMPATFIWPEGMDDSRVRVNFEVPGEWNWDVATQLIPTSEEYTFTAPDLYYFLDSPTELSDFNLREWDVVSGDNVYRIHLAVHHDGSDDDLDRYESMAKKVVDEQIGIYGEAPAFDYGNYTFIACYLPHVSGDGMEHRNSTILTSTRPLRGAGALQNLGTLSHEFLHAWNIERLRPATLEPFDFREANVSDVLWFGEGFTSYYDDLTIRRGGITDDADYATGWNGTLNYVLNSPGSEYFSAAEMSMQAPFVDAASSIDPQNRGNTFISYYSWGSVIGLGLDLTLRSEFGLTLDSYMQLLWEKFGKPEIPYTIEELESVLGELTDDPSFAGEFFSRYILGHEIPDLASLFEHAGMKLQKANPGNAVLTFGNQISFDRNRANVRTYPTEGSPIFGAGMSNGDILLRVDNAVIRNQQQLDLLLSRKSPGERVMLEYQSLGETRSAAVDLAEDPTLELILFEDAGLELTDEMIEFRNNWLGSKAGEK